MKDTVIFKSCAERLKSLDTPSAAEKIAVIPTPYLLDGREILLGKRHQGHLIALFPNEKNRNFISVAPVKLSNGFQISLQALTDPTSKMNLEFIELSNIGNIDITLFGAFLDELLTLIESENESLINIVENLLAKWKNMLSLDIEKVLPLKSVIGLFGELLFLDFLINIRNLPALEQWVGPNGNRHDFEFKNHSIEVKSTTVKNGNDIHVSGVTQLEPYPGKTVTILRIKLEIEPNGVSLPQLIERIAANRTINSETFKEKLLKVGYQSEKELHYRDLRFQAIEFQVIPVDLNFPRITSNSLLEIDRGARISDVEYVVSTSGLETQRQAYLELIDFEGLL